MKNLTYILIAFTFLACNNDDDNTNDPAVQTGPIVFVDIYQDYLRVSNPVPIIQPSNLIIETNADWNNLLNQLTPAFSQAAINGITQANIDFSQESIIMVIRDVMPHLEFVEVTEIMENATNIEVTTQDSNFNSGFQVITQPYHIVKIPKTTKPIIFL